MLHKLRRFYDIWLSPDSAAAQDPEQATRLATAALLMEMARMDESIAPDERHRVTQLLQTFFQLSAQESTALQELAEHTAQEAASYHEFTAQLNRHFSQEQKIKVIEYLWEVAYADDQLDKYEEHFVRKITDLLHVAHKDFIASKHRVLDRRGG
jgi:uncharacterized tellurite resistance protein B-like protein